MQNNADLTKRELEILVLAADGKSDIEIGLVLGISGKTVNYHIEKIKTKYSVRTRIQAIVAALRQNKI